MAHKDLMALYSRLGLVIAAFALVAGIVGGPLLQQAWSSHRNTVAQGDRSDLRLPKPHAGPMADKQG